MSTLIRSDTIILNTVYIFIEIKIETCEADDEQEQQQQQEQQEIIVFGMSERMKEVVFHNSRVYYYLSQNVDKTITTWRCSQYFRKNKCKALVRTNNEDGKYINSSATPHSCQPKPQRIAKLQSLNSIK